MARNEPLPLGKKDWIRRWLVLPSWNRLHRVSSINWYDDERLVGEGETLCGWYNVLQIPGVMSRLGLPRCKHCCRIMGIESGDGNPYNHSKGKDPEGER